MMRTPLWVVTILSLSGLLGAQGVGGGGVGDGKQRPPKPPKELDEQTAEQVKARIQEMRQAIREGLPIISHVRVTVKLRNDHKMKGVVKNGRFIEKVDGLHFVPAEMQSEGAGLRVWYYDNTNSYIFLPFEAIASYKIGQRLTDVQLKQIEDKIEQERLRAEQARQERLAALARKNGEPATGEQITEDDERTKRLLALVEEFPPDAGWSAERRRQIEVRKVTVGAYPNETEQRFLTVFDDWQEGVRIHEKRAAGGDGAGAGPTPMPLPKPDAGGPPPGPAPKGATPPGPGPSGKPPGR